MMRLGLGLGLGSYRSIGAAGAEFVEFAGGAGEKLSTTSPVAQSFGVGWYCRAELDADEVTSAAQGAVFNDGFGTPGWTLEFSGANRLLFYYRDANGTNFEQSSVSMASLGLPAGRVWISATLQTLTTARFEYSLDDKATWTQIGADQAITSIDPAATRTATISVGARGTSAGYIGKVYRAETPDVTFDPADLSGWS